MRKTYPNSSLLLVYFTIAFLFAGFNLRSNAKIMNVSRMLMRVISILLFIYLFS